jgi:non-ribosomal peptide synthetase component F
MSMLLQDLVARQARRRPDAVALAFKEIRFTYGRLDSDSNRVARALRQAGVRPGDRVCFLAPKSPLPLVWMLGILKAGAIHVPLDPAARPGDPAHILFTSGSNGGP